MPAKPIKSRATYRDLEELPLPYVGELVDGDLHASPRPTPRHGHLTVALTSQLAPHIDPGAPPSHG